jgi:CBS domain-containing protein
MTMLDKAKTTAERMRVQAKKGMERGRARLDEAQARRQYSRLLRRLGEAQYAEHSGQGTHEETVRALAAVDAHRQAYPEALASGHQESTRQAREIMHAGAECVSADENLATAARMMRDLGVGSLPICGADDRLHGIITDRDIVIKCIAEGGDPAQTRAGDLAQDTLFWVDATADMAEVLHQMEDHQVKRLPVIENHRLVGMISEADLARNLDEHRLAVFIEKVYATS